MLVLSRKLHQRIIVGKSQEIIIEITEISKNQVRVGIIADKDIPVIREELIKPEQQ